MATPEIKSVSKAFALLDHLAASGGCLSLPAMAEGCGMTSATAHRLLATLESLGAVVHAGPGRYAIGLRLLELTQRSSLEGLLASSAIPILNRITRATGATAHVGMLDDEGMVTYIARSAGRSSHIPTHPGNKLEAYCSGLGKVLLAGLSSTLRENYLAEGSFPALTDHTIAEPDALARELMNVASQRYAIDNFEMFEDLRCVAVPILDSEGKVVAALSTSGTRSELPVPNIPTIVAELSRHASSISAKLYPRAI